MIKNTIQELEHAEITAVAGGVGVFPPIPKINDNPLFSKIIAAN
jgi:hypothetical protein